MRNRLRRLEAKGGRDWKVLFASQTGNEGSDTIEAWAMERGSPKHRYQRPAGQSQQEFWSDVREAERNRNRVETVVFLEEDAMDL